MTPMRWTGKNETDLIDTQWNVNYVFDTLVEYLETDLIDTQWNVNLNFLRLVYVLLRFNRYIVECKFRILIHKGVNDKI